MHLHSDQNLSNHRKWLSTNDLAWRIAESYFMNFVSATVAIYRLMNFVTASGTIVPYPLNAKKTFHLLEFHILQKFSSGFRFHKARSLIVLCWVKRLGVNFFGVSWRSKDSGTDAGYGEKLLVFPCYLT